MTHLQFTDQLPAALYTAAQVRELDRLTIAAGTPGFELMTRAGEAAFSLLNQQFPKAQRCVVLCGSGNNGGDGYVVARLALQAGMQVNVVAITLPERLQGDARLAFESARDAGVLIDPLDNAVTPNHIKNADIIVDAILGTGLNGEVKGSARQAIEAVNAAGTPVLAIDIPSGLCADTGEHMGVAVTAAVTITFIGMKIGLVLACGPKFSGKTYFADLRVPPAVRAQVSCTLHQVTPVMVYSHLPKRAHDAHKGHFGHVLVIGGDFGMGGAAAMAAEAAARTGAGLTSVVTRVEHLTALLARRPELMVHPITDNASIEAQLSVSTVVVIGPGLGRAEWGERLFQQAISSGKLMVIDADGLHWLAQALAQTPSLRAPARWVLTPHPGEAARLLQTSTQQVQADRIAAVRALQSRFGGVAVLKGAGTLICSETFCSETICDALICDKDQQVSLAAVGNPGMATGGMGDVLSGIIGGLVAQGLPLAVAAMAGVWLHGMAADQAAIAGERGLLATDLFGPLRQLINPFSHSFEGSPSGALLTALHARDNGLDTWQ